MFIFFSSNQNDLLTSFFCPKPVKMSTTVYEVQISWDSETPCSLSRFWIILDFAAMGHGVSKSQLVKLIDKKKPLVKPLVNPKLVF